MSNYVISDIHGQYKSYKRMLRAIQLQPEDTLYVLGDVIDRGPDGIKILNDMMKRENVIMFMGNHELMIGQETPEKFACRMFLIHRVYLNKRTVPTVPLRDCG